VATGLISRNVPKRSKRGNVGGRPSIFPGGNPHCININDDAWEKAERDADVLSGAAGIRVSTSQAIEAAVRTFDAKEFKP